VDRAAGSCLLNASRDGGTPKATGVADSDSFGLLAFSTAASAD
jgi:hypothetical protein